MERNDGELRPLMNVDDVPEGEGKRVRIDDTYIALFKVDGKVYAINALCPHAGALLDMGWMEGHTVHCPMHGWDFDVRTGVSATFGERVACYDIEVREGTIYLRGAACQGN